MVCFRHYAARRICSQLPTPHCLRYHPIPQLRKPRPTGIQTSAQGHEVSNRHAEIPPHVSSLSTLVLSAPRPPREAVPVLSPDTEIAAACSIRALPVALGTACSSAPCHGPGRAGLLFPVQEQLLWEPASDRQALPVIGPCTSVSRDPVEASPRFAV